jgi:hypothetical protein
LDPRGHGFAAAAHGLDVHRLQPPGQALFFHQAADLVHLAAQAENDDVGEIRVPSIAGKRAAQQAQRLILCHSATGLVGQRDDTVDIREIRQRIVAGERVAAEHVGDHARDMSRAVHARQDADVVACRNFPVRTADAFEGRGSIDEIRRPRIGAVGVILGEIAHLQVVHMDVLAGRDRGGCKADDLAIAPHGLRRGNGAHGNLMASRNLVHRCDVFADRHARRQRRSSDHHIVLRVQADDGRRCHGCFLWV